MPYDHFSKIRWVVMGLKPFSFVEDPLEREMAKMSPISVFTLKKYTKIVMVEIRSGISCPIV